MENYWARNLPPAITANFYTRVDTSVQTMVLYLTQLDTSILTNFTKERMRLPIKLKGMGLMSLYARRNTEYIKGMIKGTIPSTGS